MLLLELAARPDYQPLLRDEIRQVVLGEEGKGEWTLASIGRLHKLDSFMRETRRVRPLFNGTAHFPIPLTHPIPFPQRHTCATDGRRLRLDGGKQY